MEYCDECDSLMVPDGMEWICVDCGAAKERDKPAGPTIEDEKTPESTSKTTGNTELERLETSESGNVKKADAMKWLNRIEEPTDKELKSSIVPKRSGFSGSTFPTEISNIRLTGDPEFIETAAGLFKALLDLEDSHTRLELNLKQIEDRDTDELTNNYALYLSVAERGG